MLIAAQPVPRPAVPFTPRLVTDARLIAELSLRKRRAGESHCPVSRFQKSPHLAPWMLCSPVELP